MKAITVFSVLFSFWLVSGCHKDEFKVPEGNLIFNSTFEVNGIPSFEGWIGSSYSFVEDVPSEGGRWALQLEPEWLPGEGYAETEISGYKGSYTFKFTCDAKSLNEWKGLVSLRLMDDSGTVTILKTIEFNYPSWSKITASIKVSLAETDRLIIRLSAGATELTTGKVLFDNVNLVRD